MIGALFRAAFFFGFLFIADYVVAQQYGSYTTGLLQSVSDALRHSALR